MKQMNKLDRKFIEEALSAMADSREIVGVKRID